MDERVILQKPNVSFQFQDSLPDVVTEYDVVMAYELFLGRAPENAAVIGSHRARRFDNLVKTFMNAPEFVLSTVEPIRNGTVVERLDRTEAPTRNQVAWLADHLVLQPDDAIRLYGAASWNAFFQLLLSLGHAAGMPAAPVIAEPIPEPILAPIPAPPAEPNLAPAAAAEITVPAIAEQPDMPIDGRDVAVLARLEQIDGLLAEIRTLLHPEAG